MSFGMALACSIGLLTACTDTELSVKVFEDVTANSGLGEYVGMTHGAAWGDVDGDGLPDLYVTNHLNAAQLFRNKGNGQFQDVTNQYFEPKDILGDKHGAAWADYDNDGRLDLVQLTGAGRGIGAEPKFLFHNLGGKFQEIAKSVGVENAYGRTRIPLWYDFNRDGRLDLFHGAEKRFDDRTPPFIFVQQNGKFVAFDGLKFAAQNVPFCVITSLNKEGNSELVCRVSSKTRTAQIFDTKTIPARERNLLPATAFDDIAAADFDNDGLIDLFMARKNAPGPVAFGRPSEQEVIADMRINHANVNKPMGFIFDSTGHLTFHIVVASHPRDILSLEQIYLGKQGAHPDDFTFSVSPEASSIVGMTAGEPGAQAGVYVGQISSNQWEVRVTAPRDAFTGKAKSQQIAIKITSTAVMTELESIGDPIKVEAAPARLFMNKGDKLVEEADKRGAHKRIVAGMNVVAGDFDNDMDVDLFVLASGDIGKQENLLLFNQGDGEFDVVVAAGGAAGHQVGVGDSVTVVDFDGDGFLDLLTATGGSMGRSLGLPSENGAYHLYRNIGNDNHWIEIDLEGTKSNRDGIGALVRVEADGIIQVRVQDGGLHNRSQNHQRLHFGLARNQQIDKVTIFWPSGQVQELGKIKVDQVIELKEPN